MPASSAFTQGKSELGSQKALLAGRRHSSKWQAAETQGTAPGTWEELENPFLFATQPSLGGLSLLL